MTAYTSEISTQSFLLMRHSKSLKAFWSNPSNSHLEAEDDGPDEAESEAVVPINYIMRTNVF